MASTVKLSVLESLPQLGDRWQKERRVLNRLVRLCFGVAGVLWLPLSLLQITPAERFAYLVVQYQLYVLLLTLWGYDYRRQLKRSECVLALAHSADVSPAQVQWEQVVSSGQASLFDVLRRRAESRGWFAVVFTWLLLIGSYLWLGRQIFRLIEFATTP